MVKVQCPGTPDSMQAGFRFMSLSAIAGDPTYGFTYDSLQSIYRNTVIDYMILTPGDTSGQGEPEMPIKLTADGMSGGNGFYLEQNIPNPFSDKTDISYSIGENCFVRLYISDLLGNTKIVLVNEQKTPGKYKAEFNNGSLQTGFYFYTLEVCGKRISKKLQIIN